MIPNRFTTDSYAVFNDNLGFRLCKRVPFQGVTGIGEADPVIFF